MLQNACTGYLAAVHQSHHEDFHCLSLNFVTSPHCYRYRKMEVRLCNREERNLTTCWICFFFFNLCFQLLLFTKRILSIHNGLPRGTLPLCLNVEPKCLCSGKQPEPVHLWMATRKKKLTLPFLRLAIPGDICKTYGLFTLLPHLLLLSVL